MCLPSFFLSAEIRLVTSKKGKVVDPHDPGGGNNGNGTQRTPAPSISFYISFFLPARFEIAIYLRPRLRFGIEPSSVILGGIKYIHTTAVVLKCHLLK